jgi:hypothetical protein
MFKNDIIETNEPDPPEEDPMGDAHDFFQGM